MKCIYPFVGNTASSQKYNLKDARDLNAAYRLTFSGGGTFSSNGYQLNGTNAWADTFLIPSSALISADVHLSVYSRTNSSTQSKYEIGMQDDGGTIAGPKELWQGWYGYVSGKSLGGIQNGFHVQYNETDSLGMLTTSRISTTSLKIYKNGVYKAIDTNVISASGLPQMSIPIGAFKYRNSGGTITYDYGIRQIAFASIGNGLTDAEALAFYNAVQLFNTTLARQV